MVSDQKNWNHSFISRVITNIFFLKVWTTVNFSPTSFFKIESWAEKSGTYCRRITVFMLILRHVYQNTHKKSIIHNLKFLSDEKLRTNIGFNLKPPRALYLVLRWCDINSPEDQKWPWISWESGLVQPIELKFLPEAYLTRITHPWKFQPKRTILRGKSFVRRGPP
jgi:hypothetical protein